MKIRNQIEILSILLGVVFASCNFLDRDIQTDTTLSHEAIFSNPHRATGFFYNIYNDLIVGHSRLDFATLGGASDEAFISNSTSAVHLLNFNGISPTSNPDDVWYIMYRSIRKCNIFLKELDGIIAQSNSIALADRPVFRGEAIFLRAWMYFELMRRYQNVVWVDDILSPYEEEDIYRYKQKSFLQMTEILSQECDSAAKLLPVTPRTGGELGRPIASAPLALKSRLWLYAASPLNNRANDVELWKKAEDAAKEVMDRFRVIHATSSDYASIFNSGNYVNEVIFGTAFTNRNDLERNYLPISFSGNGLINPTQNLMDEYPVQATNYNEPMKGFDPQNPYNKRDARMAATVIYNGMELKDGQFVETFDGGKDAFGKSSTATRTGYYLRKYLKPDLDLTTNEQARRQWILMRYSEILLNYAEARNEVLGNPDKEVWLTLNPLRLRGKLRPFPNSGVQFTKDQMRDYIKHERRIELAFEEHRFWDVRRWTDATSIDCNTIHGMSIIRKSDDTYLYSTQVVENRLFDPRMYWYPIPQSEVLKYLANKQTLVQNEGW